MDVAVELNVAAVLAAVSAVAGAVARHFYLRWSEAGRYDHFRTLVIEKVMNELTDRWNSMYVTGELSRLVRVSDVVVSSLIDAGFDSREIPHLFAQACQDTRGRFTGLIKALNLKAIVEETENYPGFVRSVDEFFEPDLRLKLAHQKKN